MECRQSGGQSGHCCSGVAVLRLTNVAAECVYTAKSKSAQQYKKKVHRLYGLCVTNPGAFSCCILIFLITLPSK